MVRVKALKVTLVLQAQCYHIFSFRIVPPGTVTLTALWSGTSDQKTSENTTKLFGASQEVNEVQVGYLCIIV